MVPAGQAVGCVWAPIWGRESDAAMKWKSKKAITLVEMIVSIAIIALISVMLLGLLVPAMNMQKWADEANEIAYTAADQVESQIAAMTDSPNPSEDTLRFTIDSTQYECSGTLVESTQDGVTVRAFVPDEPEE